MSLKSFFKSTSTRNQYLAAFAVNIITLSHGCALGWLSPSLPYLRSDESHLVTGPVSSDEVSWIGSSLCIGGFIGTIAFGKIAEMLGKKKALLLLVFPHLCFWLLVLTSTHIYHLYIARVCAGLTGGGTLRTVSLYITEISENKIRGRLGSYLILFLCTGTLLVFIAGTYLSFFTVPYVMLMFPVTFFVSVLFLPDTPQSLMSKNKADEAWDSLMFYRTCGANKVATESVKEEFQVLKQTLEHQNSEKLQLKDFLTKPAKLGIAVGLFLMFLNQFSGTFAIMTYTADIIKDSGSDLSPNKSSVIVSFIQLVGVYISTICVERCGRKILMSISCIGASLFFFVLATYSYLKQSGSDLSNLEWLPVLSLSLVVFIASLGIISLPFVITTELLPNKIRSTACTICMSTVTLLAFVVLKIFPPMVNAIQLHGCLWFFASICFFGAIFTICFIPETKGRSLITVNEESELLSSVGKKISILPASKP